MTHWRSLVSALLLLASATASGEQGWPPDRKGRHVIIHGIVTLTGDGQSEYNYTEQEYRRMIPLGINLQVIRLFAGQMGAWPGYSLTQAYLDKLDSMVALARKIGVVTVFKMTVYDIKGTQSGRFGPEEWTDFRLNREGRREQVLSSLAQALRTCRYMPAYLPERTAPARGHKT